MSVKQREAYLKKLDNACGDVPVASQTTYGDVGSCSLSVTPEEATITSILLPSVRDIFEKAKCLLEKQTGITAAPESDGTSHMVQSQTSRRPHYVRLCRTTGKVVCKNCPGWSSSKLCAHAVAVVEKACCLSVSLFQPFSTHKPYCCFQY